VTECDPGGIPGYCRCCRGYHLLARVEIPALSQPVDVCRFCEALGSAELAWRIGGVTENGFGYETAATAPLTGRRWPGGKRRDRARLAESLLLPDDDHGDSGFRPPRRSLVQQARMAWRMLRGRAPYGRLTRAARD
jgi:hypothetical protein